MTIEAINHNTNKKSRPLTIFEALTVKEESECRSFKTVSRRVSGRVPISDMDQTFNFKLEYLLFSLIFTLTVWSTRTMFFGKKWNPKGKVGVGLGSNRFLLMLKKALLYYWRQRRSWTCNCSRARETGRTCLHCCSNEKQTR